MRHDNRNEEKMEKTFLWFFIICCSIILFTFILNNFDCSETVKEVNVKKDNSYKNYIYISYIDGGDDYFNKNKNPKLHLTENDTMLVIRYQLDERVNIVRRILKNRIKEYYTD